MERLTYTCEDGTHRAAHNLPCAENSWEYKELLINKLGAYEDTGLTPQEIMDGKMLTGWIPVEERLPEEPNAGAIEMEDLQEYIAMIEGAELPTVLLYIGNGAWCTAGVFYKVVAWMPLPEPYRPEE